LQQYTSAFNPSFVALRGDEAATKAAAASFKVFYAKSKGADASPLNYSIDHTAASFVFDPKGNVRLFVRNGQAVDSLVKDLLTVLK
jgi:protein SCO1/2